MNADLSATRKTLIRDVVILQFKLLIGAARDLAVVPVTLGAALLDLILSKHQAPRFFHHVLRLGELSERWIDTWSAGRKDDEPQRGNVDALLGASKKSCAIRRWRHRARVLRRWGNGNGPGAAAYRT
jgi:hypothetical protein